MIYGVMTKEGFMQENKFGLRKLNTEFAKYFIVNIKHWHGATKESWFSHLVIEV